MAAEEKILEVGRESHETPQAITITIVDPSALDGNTLSTSLVTSVEAQDDDADPGSSIVMVSGEGPKSILQTVTETHMGDEELPIISNISNPDEEEELEDEETVVDMNKVEAYDAEGEEAEAAESFEAIGLHCLICNLDLATVEEDEHIPVFKTQTSTTHRKLAVFLGSLTGQKLTSRKAHSDILCRRCFSLLDRVDSLEVEIKETKEEIVNKYQETVSAYGGRARRRKPTTAKKTDYVFPKVEPEDEADQLLEMELDGNFEPQVEDLMEEDPGIQDEEWEPEFKKPRIKRESSEIDSTNGPPKRKRGRPRKDATKPKELDDGDGGCIPESEGKKDEAPGEGHLDCLGRVETKSCVYCGEDVPSAQLSIHFYGHEYLQYSCPFCQYKSPCLSLSRHLQQEHRANFITCGVCSFKFMDAESYNNHQSSHIIGSHVCKTCDAIFGTGDELINHRNLKHAIRQSLVNSCPVCKKIFRMRSKLVAHIIKFHKGKVHIDGLVWTSGRLLVCDVCQKSFQKPSLYLAHEKTHIENKFHCPHCQNTSPTHCRLQDHILTHLFGDYECDECSVKFVSQNQVVIHKEKVHKRNPSLVCEFCHKKFRLQLELISHKRKAHPESEESRKAKHSCYKCGMKFMMKGNLVKHLRAHAREKDEKLSMCDVCGKVLANKHSLTAHIRTHSRDSTNKCTICDKTFVSKYTLLDHIRRIHNDYNGSGKDKVCDQCGRSFFTNSELKYHMKSHTGERPYRCDICAETYMSSSTLRYHMQKHSNILFACQECNAKFEKYVGWSAHMKRVHGVSCMKEYTRQHGILQVVKSREAPPLYICPDCNTKFEHYNGWCAHVKQAHGIAHIKEYSKQNRIWQVLTGKGAPPFYIHTAGQGSVMDDSQNAVVSDLLRNEVSATLTVGQEETVASVRGKEVDNVIQVVSYDNQANPLIHTVDATDVGLSGTRDTNISHSNLEADLGANPVDSEDEDDYHPDSTEEWEMILPGNEGALVISEEWGSARMGMSQSGGQQMVLSDEWDGEQDMASLITAEEREVRVGMATWKACVDY